MDEETLTVWLDTALLMLGGFGLMATLMMTVMNPPATSSEADGVPAPGNVIVEAQWADQVDADVDLWVQAPGDRPVGYSNKSGQIFNLLRDDLGKSHDITDYNYEVAYTRGTPGGEYVVNLADSAGHIVTNPTAQFDIDVTDDGVSIGTISIADTGAFTFTTDGGTAKAIGAGSVIRFVAPTTPDAAAASLAATLVGTLD